MPLETTASVQIPAARPAKLYNTFEGVFKPTLLTILGAIMYLRMGWVVGNAGLLGGLLVVLAVVSITLATGLSVASIATNTRLGAGGPYAMISKSLGVEVGGAVGVPLFLSQALAVAMYIFGLREGWLHIFPRHLPWAIDLAAFAAIFAVAFISAGLAFRIQYLVLVAIAASLISIFSSSATWASPLPVVWWGKFPGALETGFSGISFWGVFAVFFPAVTGIMSGVNMSGELQNSRRSIPVGTLSAIAVSSVVYLALSWGVSRAAPPGELLSNYTILVDRSLWKPAVMVGLLAATFSAALSSLVGAPRILMALGRDGVIPGGSWVAQLSRNGEPRRALLVAGAIVFCALLVRDLNAIAPLTAMFFLITYATVNLVVLVESSLGLMNFRPTLRLTRWVPLYGVCACLWAMFVINPTFSLLASIVVVAIAVRIVGQKRQRWAANVRSGLFVAIAQWAATKTIELDLSNARAWRPDLLVPVADKSQLLGEFRLLLDLCQPEGTVNLLGLTTEQTVEDLSHRIADLSRALRRRGIFTTFSIMGTIAEAPGAIAALQVLQSAFFRPNVLFLRAPDASDQWDAILPAFREARRLGVGVILFGSHPQAGLGRAEVVNLWIRPQFAELPAAERLQKGSMNLAILMALRLVQAWKGQLNLISVVKDKENVGVARAYVEDLRELCRIPQAARTVVDGGGICRMHCQSAAGGYGLYGPADDPGF